MEEKMMSPIHINPREDYHVFEKELSLISGYESSVSIHFVTKHIVAKGEFAGTSYFIFDYVNGKGAGAFSQDDFKNVKKKIEIKKDDYIFFSAEGDKSGLMNIPKRYYI